MKNLWLLLLFGALAGFADEPSFAFLNKGTYYPLSRDIRFPFSSAQVTNLEIVVSKCHVNNLNAYSPRFPVGQDELNDYVERSTYGDFVKEPFRSGSIRVDNIRGRMDSSSASQRIICPVGSVRSICKDRASKRLIDEPLHPPM